MSSNFNEAATAQQPEHPVSGRQVAISHGDYSAVVASVGASLRELTHQGRHLVVPFDADEIRPGYRGANLVPWPNRIADGAYTFNGFREQLALNEVDRRTALHGLALWNEWTLVEHTPERAVFTTVIEPQAGYPHRLDVQVAYTLSDEGLDWHIHARNRGPSTAPYGVAPHPYLVAGEGVVDDWTVELPAAQVLCVTADRLLPTSLTAVITHDGGSFDFQTPRTMGGTAIDHAFTALTPNTCPIAQAGGDVEVRLAAPSGTGVLMRWHAGSLPWVQIHTADRPDAPELHRIGLAVEPMSCPPDAFNSGTDLILLAPGGHHDAQWTIAAL